MLFHADLILTVRDFMLNGGNLHRNRFVESLFQLAPAQLRITRTYPTHAPQTSCNVSADDEVTLYMKGPSYQILTNETSRRGSGKFGAASGIFMEMFKEAVS